MPFINPRRRLEEWTEAIRETKNRISKMEADLPTLTEAKEIAQANNFIKFWTDYIRQGELVIAEDRPIVEKLDAQKRVYDKAMAHWNWNSP